MQTLGRLFGALFAGVFWLLAGGLAIFLVTLVVGVLGMFVPFFLFGVGGPFGALLILVLAAKVTNRLREARAALVLGYIAQAVRLNMPVPAMLDASAASERWPSSTMLQRVADAVRGGASISDSIAQHVRAVSERQVSLLRSAERVGRLPAIMGEMVEDNRKLHESRPVDDVLVWAYGLMMIVMIGGMLGFFGIYIAPRFRGIFMDFEITMPMMTRLTFAFGEAAQWLLMPLAVVLGLGAAGWSVWALLHWGERRDSIAHGPVDALCWWLPFVGGLARDRGLGDAFHVMSEALHAGRPLDQAAVAGANIEANTVMQRRLRRFANGLHGGQSPSAAARAARLPNLTVRVLATGQAGHDLTHAIRFLHRYYATRFSRVVEIARGTAIPAMVGILGLVVAWVVISLILPLVTLIYNVNMFTDPPPAMF